MPSGDKVEIKKIIKCDDVQIKTEPISTTYISTKPKKNRNRRLKKTRHHPYNVKRESVGLKKANEIIKKYLDFRKKRVKKKLTEDELKVLAENELEFTKYVPPNDVQFIKQVPLHPRETLQRTLAAKVKKNKKGPPPIHPRERLKQKVANLKQQLKQKTADLDDKLKIIRVAPSHPRDRL